MCIGTPMKVLSSGHGVAVAAGRGQTERLNMLMVGELPPGTWVLAFQGSALRMISAEEAAQTDAALDALAVQELTAWGFAPRPRVPGAPFEPLNDRSLAIDAYEAGRPSPDQACRVADPRVLALSAMPSRPAKER